MMRELEVAVKAARAAAEVLSDTMGADLGISYKDARANLVTVADKQSQQVITEVIAGAFPDHAIVGEEGTAGDPGVEHVWYVDPLDGTTNYAHGLPYFCVSIAHRTGGETTAGVVYDPYHDEMFAASRHGGATRNGEPLRVSQVERLDRALVVAQAQCAIAAGRLEAYCEHAMDPWDIIAGQLILEEAGGTLTRFDGQPHRTADRADVAASNGLIHTELLTVLKGEDLP